MNFSQALDLIKWGQPMTREAWGNPAVYVVRDPPVPGNDYNINKRLANGEMTPWEPTVDDIMANDWATTIRID